jgi:hypothetical protein
LGKDLILAVGVNKPNGGEFRFKGDLRRLKLAVAGAEAEVGDESSLRLIVLGLFFFPRELAYNSLLIQLKKKTYYA